MSKSKINIGVEIDLPRLIDTRALIQASSGGGKSYLLRRVVESVGNSVQQIIIDPEGEFLTLREKFDFILVSKDGDIPINLRYAETLAHRILETNVSAIIDLYEFAPHERIIFVKRFLTAIVNAPKQLWHPCIIYVDEADKFAPEGKASESVSSVINLCAQGRKRGYCAVLATQRLSKLNKDATAELLNKFIGRTGQDIDRKRAGDELGFANKTDFIGLRQLEPGEFYSFGPAISNEVLKFKVSKVITTHPKSGSRIAVNPPIPNAIKKILNKLSDIPEEAERELETKKQLQDEVKRLMSELKKSPKPTTPPVNDKAAESAKLEVKRQYDIVIKDRDNVIKGLQERIHEMQKQLSKINSLSIVKEVGSPMPVVIHERKEQASHIIKSSPKTNNSSSIPSGPHKMLKVLAMLSGESISRERLSMLSGYSITSSTFGIYINKLKELGYVQTSGNDIAITNEGLESVGDYEQLPTNPESLISYWSNKIPSGPGKMFNILTNHYPNEITREKLSEESGYSMTSSTFGIYINKLKTLRLVSETNKMLKAADEIYS